MHITLAAATTTTITTFKPRQVLLSLSSAMKNSNLTAPAHADSKRIILNSICEYLERIGFFKSVKKLRSEAKIEADGEEGGLLDLEALCNEQLKIRLKAVGFKEKGEGKKKEIMKETFEDHQLVITSEKTDNAIEEEEEAKSKSKRKKEEAAVNDDLSAKETRTTEKDKPSKRGKLLDDKTEDKKSSEKEKVSSEQVAGEAEKDAALFSEGKKRKKKNKKNYVPDGSEGENKDNVSSEQVGGEVEKDAALISEGKKRKKKNKEIDAPDGSEGENKEEHKTEEERLVVVEGKEQTGVPTLVACSINGDAAGSAKQAKSKGKRKKEDYPIQENSLTDTTALAGEDATKKAELPTSEGPTDEKRVSKKRKKLAEENGNGRIDEEQEIGSLLEMKKSKKHKSIPLSEDADDEVVKGEKEPDKISQSMGDEGKVSQPNLQTPSGKDADVIPAKNGGEKSTQKSSSKQRNVSAEPRALNAFQRVKPEEVEFTDERLQDNSYWAKDGADSGYGAKAQEILGQVKGRDFRHEKTKKKRGSYRGGQIDLQSHSVKFNYSDD